MEPYVGDRFAALLILNVDKCTLKYINTIYERMTHESPKVGYIKLEIIAV